MEIKKLNGEKELDSQRRLIFKQSRSTAVKIVRKISEQYLGLGRKLQWSFLLRK